MSQTNPHAAALGKLGGLASTESQRAARRVNGKRGGRPIRLEFSIDLTNDGMLYELTVVNRSSAAGFLLVGHFRSEVEAFAARDAWLHCVKSRAGRRNPTGTVHATTFNNA